ncbi:MAG: hypothetical protein IT372_29350 [Polyangiaceae bacterium]|nr:hypothetical protein [Polyangiaceae bacterium]
MNIMQQGPAAQRPSLGELAYGGQVTVKGTSTMADVEVAELEVCGRRAAVFSTPQSGIAVGVRVDLPRAAELSGLQLESDKAAAVLGHLTMALSTIGHQAQLMAGPEGVEAVMLTSHVHAASGPAVTARIQELVALADSLSPALAEPVSTLIESIRQLPAARPSGILQGARPAAVAVAPTFNEAARDEMMRRYQDP